jgi:4-hydroxy-4-methyl-2-oxoglutarate aldolase
MAWWSCRGAMVPRRDAADVARLGNDRVAKEQKTRERLRSGELGLDFYGLRAKLAELGVQYVDELKE